MEINYLLDKFIILIYLQWWANHT